MKWVEWSFCFVLSLNQSKATVLFTSTDWCLFTALIELTIPLCHTINFKNLRGWRLQIKNLLPWSNHPKKLFLLSFGAKVNPLAKATPGVFGIISKHLKEGKGIHAQVFAGLFVLSNQTTNTPFPKPCSFEARYSRFGNEYLIWVNSIAKDTKMQSNSHVSSF